MPTRETAPTGAPCWIDLSTTDTGRARDFYCALFGWTAEEPNPEFGGYFNFQRDGARIAGCMAAMPDAGASDIWSIYLAVDDAKKTVDDAAANGAVVVVPPMDVADLGTMAVLVDPVGAGIGIWQPGLHPGFTVLGEPGAPSWFELHTRDYQASLAFYRTVFGWDLRTQGDTPEFRYSIANDGDDQLAGVMEAQEGMLPDGVNAAWTVYVATADADASLAQIAQLGGSVVMPAEDTPYGRLAVAADPMGAVFRLHQPNP